MIENENTQFLFRILQQILERTGYKIEVTVGQRKYGGPPPDGPERPATRSEVCLH